MMLLLLVDAFRDHAAAFEYMEIPGFRQVPLLASLITLGELVAQTVHPLAQMPSLGSDLHHDVVWSTCGTRLAARRAAEASKRILVSGLDRERSAQL
jgi:hypothetical protein